MLESLAKIMKPVLDDCPVCEATDVAVDLRAHGPGIAVLDYGCGCVYHADENETYGIRHDNVRINLNK